MNNRAYAVDILRGLAIVGMVLSGYIAWNPDLPAWLFHAQLPPPSFVFDASVAGITWVDLVFPFFLFSMGAAFPLSLGRRLDRGDPPRRIVVSILKRGLLLAFFAVALGNTGLWTLDAVLQRPVVSALVTMTVWGAFFAMFVRIPGFIPRQNGWLNAGGIAVLAVLMGVYRWLGVGVSVVRSDIIILILADVVVAGSLIWWLTRRNLWLRMGIVALIAALKLGAAVPGSWNEAVWNFSPVPWLFRTEFLQYLCIVLPGSVAGDLFARWLARGQQEERPALSGQIAAAGLTALLLAVNMWGLFTRTLTLNLVLTLALGAAAWMLLRKPRTGTESRHGELLFHHGRNGFARAAGHVGPAPKGPFAGRSARPLRAEPHDRLHGGGLRRRAAARLRGPGRGAPVAVGSVRLRDGSRARGDRHPVDDALHGGLHAEQNLLAHLTKKTGPKPRSVTCRRAPVRRRAAESAPSPDTPLRWDARRRRCIRRSSNRPRPPSAYGNPHRGCPPVRRRRGSSH